ncbi:hypothetical protein WDJ50_13970 [Deinococcus sp. VB142]|uniref:Uncharacterized protein n=1 Tax=Deinococcus sp. VB142 TaxID=3112952 RepID=A0AAU6Q2Q2_9DEIO
MTGHRSEEQLDVPQENRSTNSESATKFPTPQSGVVQDSPGNSNVGVEPGGQLDSEGEYVKGDSNVLDAPLEGESEG